MLIGNYSVFTKTCGRARSGSSVSDTRANYNKSGAVRGSQYGEMGVVGVSDRAGVPNGYRPPYSWMIAQKDGGLSLYYGANGSGSISNSNLAGGLNAEATLLGVGTISNAALGLIVSAVATILGSGTLSATVVGALNASATLAGSGDFTASLRALGNAIATIIGTGTITDANSNALGNISASIIVGEQGALTPTGLAAAVWNAIAADFNTSGTMGEKLNSASAAGDPWAIDLVTYNTPGTAGKKMKDNLTQNKFLGLK
jgi:hypothetical protein